MEDLKSMNTTKTVKIAFFKGNGTYRDFLIRYWTKSPYSHTEFIRSDGTSHSNDRKHLFSRIAILEFTSNDWDIFEFCLPIEIVNKIEQRQLSKIGTKYDWKGIIFSQFFKWGWHSSQRWFCSKSNADDLRFAYFLMKHSGDPKYQEYIDFLFPFSVVHPQHFSPKLLYSLLVL